MIVKEIMKTAVGTCAPDSDLSAVIVATMRNRDCGFLPVVDSQGIVVALKAIYAHRAVEAMTA